MIKKHFWKIVALLVIVAIGGAIVYSKQMAQKANEGVTVETHVKGNPDAAVTLVEYSDFQCPACGAFFPYVEDVVDDLGADLRFEYKHFPLITIHPNAVPAAIAAEAAGQQGKFWEMYAKLFEDQSAWSKSGNARTYFMQYAEELGLDMDQFKLHLGSSVLEDAVMDDFNEARDHGFTGTPTFMLNGAKMEFSTYEEFRTQVEDAITAAASSSE